MLPIKVSSLAVSLVALVATGACLPAMAESAPNQQPSTVAAPVTPEVNAPSASAPAIVPPAAIQPPATQAATTSPVTAITPSADKPAPTASVANTPAPAAETHAAAQTTPSAPAAEPAKSEPAKSEPAKSEPAKADAAGTEPAKTEPAKTEATAATPPPAAAEPAPAFTLAIELNERLAHEKTSDKASGTAREDRDAAQKFYTARNGAPLWVTASGATPAAEALAAEIGKAGDWGLDPAAFTLPEPLPLQPNTAALADTEATLTLAALKYARFARGGRMNPMALNVGIDRKAQLLAPATVLADLAASAKPDATLRGFEPQNQQFQRLREAWLAVKAGQPVTIATGVAADTSDEPKSKKSKAREAAASPPKPPEGPALAEKLLVNMEMWRWMPELGTYYIQPNIPEFMVRVIRDGKVVFAQRIVTGQPSKKTPIFSDELRLVVFKPFWNVPDSIKNREMMPQLMRGASLAKSGYRAEINGRLVSSDDDIDWHEIDPRSVRIFQPPGAANALGRVKFLFPNKHDVYLHDTPAKSLFNASSRAFSHGCVRVRDPLDLAEAILSNDKGMTRAEVDRLANSGPENNEIKLAHPVPIHITYFTATVDDAGALHLFKDVYGHEKRVELGLEGKVNEIPQEAPEIADKGPSPDERRRYADERAKKSDPVGNFFKDLFN